VLDADEHLAVTIAWLIYQKIIAAYADPNRRRRQTSHGLLVLLLPPPATTTLC
jgi:hypothetical protein